jgi:hypothetical protein
MPLIAILMAVSVLASCSTGKERTTATTTETPSTVPGLPQKKPTGAVEFSPTAADLAAISDAYVQFTGYSDCPVETLPGQMKAAVITATGVKWAFGALQPAAGCTVINDGKQYNPYLAAPFSDADDRKAVFMEPTGATWQLNWFESNPFPCPADPNHPRSLPGRGSPGVPLAVLNAVGVPLSTSPQCNTPLEFIPDAPGGH